MRNNDYRCNNYRCMNTKNNYSYMNTTNNANGYYDERGFWIPFAIGGLGGTALGLGLSNNNQFNGGYYPYPPVIYGPRPPYMPYF